MPHLKWLSVGLLMALLTSCTVKSRRVKPPGINPSVAAEAAIAQYDQDGDGSLSEKEVETSAMTLEVWDADRSGGIEREDIRERLERYLATGVEMVGMECSVFLGNRGPLVGAEVVFEPEEFLSDVVKPARGTTEANGIATISIVEEDSEDLPGYTQIGLYRVRVTHPEFKLRPEYNSDTKLSYEVSPNEEITPASFTVRS